MSAIIQDIEALWRKLTQSRVIKESLVGGQPDVYMRSEGQGSQPVELETTGPEEETALVEGEQRALAI